MSEGFVDEYAHEYASSLKDLTFNSKPHITMLTMLAEENVQHAPQIVKAIEAHLQKVNANAKLPTLYLIDSIMKNVGQVYQSLFMQNIVSNFCTVFEKVDEKVRGQMYKLRQTWSDIFPNKKLYAIDVRVKEMDPAWPILAQPPQQIGIHVNPRFLKSGKTAKVKEKTEPPAEETKTNIKTQEAEEEEMRQQLLAKQQELLKLQRQKLELELFQTQVMVEEQKRQLSLKEQQLRVQQGVPGDVQKGLSALQQLSDVAALASALGQQKANQAKMNQLPGLPGVSAQQLAAISSGQVNLSNTVLPSLLANNKTIDMNALAKKGFPNISSVSQAPANNLPAPQNLAVAIGKPGVGSLAGLPSFKKISPNKGVVGAKDVGKPVAIPKSSPKKSADKKESPKKKDTKKPTPPKKKMIKRESKPADSSIKSNETTSSSSTDHRGKKDSKSSKPASENKASRSRSKSTSISPSRCKKDSPVKSQGRKADRRERRSSHSRSRSPSRGDRPTKRVRRSPRKEKENESKFSDNRVSPLAAKDVDLRTPPMALKRESRADSADRLGLPLKTGAEPPFKKSKTGDAELDEIFGGKDQDYRQLDQPVPKLSPIREHQGWAQYKASRPDEFKNNLLRARDNVDARDSFGFGKHDHDWRTVPGGMKSGFPWQNRDPRTPGSGRDPRMHRGDPRGRTAPGFRFSPRGDGHHFYQATQENDPSIPRALMFDRGEKIMRQADAQLKSGLITIDQHREIMEQLAKLYELQRMRLIQREQRMNESFRTRRSEPKEPDVIIISPDGSPRRSKSDTDERQRENLEAAKPIRSSPPKSVSPKMMQVEEPPKMPLQDTDIRDKSQGPPTTLVEKCKAPENMAAESPISNKSASMENREEGSISSDNVVTSEAGASAEIRLALETSVPDQTSKREAAEEKLDTMEETATNEMNVDDKVEVVDSEDDGSKPKGIKFKIKTMDSLAKEKDLKLLDLQPMLEPGKPRPGLPPALPSPKQKGGPKALPIHTVMIDDKPREVRFFGDTGIVVLENNDPREIAFRGPPQEVIIGKQLIRLSFLDKRREFVLDGYRCNVRFGAPTREIIIDEAPYSAIFGGPPFPVTINGKKYDVRLCGPTPEVYFGDKPRYDLLPQIMESLRLENSEPSARPPPIVKDRELPDRPGPGWVTSTIGRDYDARDWKHRNRDSPPPFARSQGRDDWRDERRSSRFNDEPPFRHERDWHFRDERRPPVQPPRGEFRDFDQWDRRGEPHREGFRPGARGALPPSMRSERGPSNHRGSPTEFYDREARNSPYRESPPRQGPYFPDRRFPHGPPPMASGQQGLPPMNPQNRFDGPPNAGMMNIPPRGPHSMQGPHGMPPNPGMRYNAPFGYPPPNAHGPPAQQGFQRPNFGFPSNSQNLPQGVSQRFSAPPMPVLPPQINVNELFEKLVATGILAQVSTNPENNEVEDDSVDASQSEEPNPPSAEKLPFVELKPDSLKVKQPAVISHLYCGIQCSSCGIRFTSEQTDKYAQHLDWHFRQNRREKDSARKALSRKWYFDVQDWVQFEEIEDLEERARSFFEIQATEDQAEGVDDVQPSVPAGENEEDKCCIVCHELFELYWDEDHEEWHFRDAVRHEEKNYHPLCLEDFKEQQLKEAETPLEESLIVVPLASQEDAADKTKEGIDASVKQEVDNAKTNVENSTDKAVEALEQKVQDIAVKDEVEVEDGKIGDSKNAEEPMETESGEAGDNEKSNSDEPQPMEVQETLEIFNVHSSHFTVPPGIGLEVDEVKPEEKASESDKTTVEPLEAMNQPELVPEIEKQVPSEVMLQEVGSEDTEKSLDFQEVQLQTRSEVTDNQIRSEISEKLDVPTIEDSMVLEDCTTDEIEVQNPNGPVKQLESIEDKVNAGSVTSPVCAEQRESVQEETPEGSEKSDAKVEHEIPVTLESETPVEPVEVQVEIDVQTGGCHEAQQENVAEHISDLEKPAMIETKLEINTCSDAEKQLEADVPMDSELESKTIDSVKPVCELSVEVCDERAPVLLSDVNNKGELIKLEPVEQDENELLNEGGSDSIAKKEPVASDEVKLPPDEANDVAVQSIDDAVNAPDTTLTTEVGSAEAVTPEAPVFKIENISRIPVLVSSGGFPGIKLEADEDVSLKESSDIVSEFAFEHPVSPSPPQSEPAPVASAEGEPQPQNDGRFKILPPVNRGTELSGLCSIM